MKQWMIPVGKNLLLFFFISVVSAGILQKALADLKHCPNLEGIYLCSPEKGVGIEMERIGRNELIYHFYIVRVNLITKEPSEELQKDFKVRSNRQLEKEETRIAQEILEARKLNKPTKHLVRELSALRFSPYCAAKALIVLPEHQNGNVAIRKSYYLDPNGNFILETRTGENSVLSVKYCALSEYL